VNRSCLRGADRAIVTPGQLIHFIQKSTLFFFEKVVGFREAEKSFLLLIKKKVFPPP
jgi:hypothetical protein